MAASFFYLRVKPYVDWPRQKSDLPKTIHGSTWMAIQNFINFISPNHFEISSKHTNIKKTILVILNT